MASLDTGRRIDDETLVHHCLAGDKSAFGFLVHKYKDLVHAYACQKVWNYADAEDITQEVFIRAYRNLAKLKYPHNFRSWLYTIASNECKRFLSRRMQRQRREVNLEDTPEDALGSEADFSQTPADWQIDLEEAIENLPEGNRIALSMFYMSDCSLKEISEYLGVSVNGVKSKLFRARQQLGGMLERYGRALSDNRLKGGFVMQVIEQLNHIPRPSIPPAWRSNLLRQIPLTITTALCMLIGLLGILWGSNQEEYIIPKALSGPLVQIVETVTPDMNPGLPAQAAVVDEPDTEEMLSEADNLLAEGRYRQAADRYRSLLDLTLSEQIKNEVYYGLGMSLYKADWTAGTRTDDAIDAVMNIPQASDQWLAAQLLLGRGYMRKGIWAKEDAEKQKHFEMALGALQTVLDAGDLLHQAEYLYMLCQAELGEADPGTPAVRQQLEMAREDEDPEIRFAAARALNQPIPGMRIAGTVTDKITGQPVANASVSIMRLGEGKTDLQGRYSIDNIPGRTGEAVLWVDIKGYGKKMVQFMISETESDTQVDVGLGPGATVTGRVVNPEGYPIAEANVVIVGEYYPTRSAKTDAQGRYQLDDIEVQQAGYHLSVEHSDFIDDYRLVFANKAGMVEAPDIVLKRGSTIEGLVMDETGNPVQGAFISAKWSRSAAGRDAEDETDENGQYHLKNLSGELATIIVDSPDFAPAYEKVQLDPDKELPSVDFILKSGKTLVGRVVNEQDEPIEGARLGLWSWEPVKYDSYSHSATTDASGEFRMEHLPDGKIGLRLDKEGYRYMNDYPAEVKPDQFVTNMETPIVMRKVAYIYAKVVDAETGMPVRNFRAKAGFTKGLEPGDIHLDGMPADWSSGFAFQSDTGEFRTFHAVRGMTISLEVESEGYAPAYVPRAVFGAYDEEPLIIRMNRGFHTQGAVVDAETGDPVSGAFIVMFDKSHRLEIHGYLDESILKNTIMSDAQGNFALPGTLAEEFYLYVAHPDKATAIVGPLYASKPEPIRVEMQQDCAIEGAAGPEQEVILMLIEQIPELFCNLFTQASPQGIYRFENLIPGKYHISEMIPGRVPGVRLASSGRSVAIQIQPGEVKTVDFLVKDKTRRLYGLVTEADGTPIPNATVRVSVVPEESMILALMKGSFDIWQLSPEEQLKNGGVALTDSDGRYEIFGLLPTNYRVDVKERRPEFSEEEIAKYRYENMRLPEMRSVETKFTIAEGEKEAELNIVFPEANQ
jgi:RNA polymerase sigma factor (sigma-70 family)